MSRTVRDASLESRAARARLKSSVKPYYRAIEPGLHLGYRKGTKTAGRWVARHYLGNQSYEVESLGVADDFSDADGVAILSFRDAQKKARERMVARAHGDAAKAPLTVHDAVLQYIDWMDGNRRSGVDARKRAEAFIFPSIGHIEVEKLTSDRIRQWLLSIVKTPPRVRTGKGKKQRYREALADDEEYVRRRRSTANRTLTTLKAALNRAWREGKLSSAEAWRRVQPFQNVDAARIRYMTVQEAVRLMEAASGDFRSLVRAALQTGARYSELARLAVQDFNAEVGTIAIRQSKSGKPRHVVLTEQGIDLFTELAANKRSSDLLLPRPGGGPWKASHQNRPMAEACKKAQLDEPISFHGLRHTWASLAVMNGVPLIVVAKNLGHADTRMVERHYGHLAPSYVAEAIRLHSPRF